MKRLALLLVPLVGCSALPVGGRAMSSAPAAVPHHHGAAATTNDRAANASALPRPSRPPQVRSAAEQLARLPLTFEPATERNLYAARAARYAVRVAPTWAEVRSIGTRDSTAASAPSVVTMRFEGAEAGPRQVALTEATARVSYFRGSHPGAWRPNLPTYRRVSFERVYPGIDVAYYGTNREIEYDIVVAPGADPGLVALRFDGAATVDITPGGDLAIVAGSETLALRAPVAYQEALGRRTPITVRYEPAGPSSVRLAVGAYDAKQTLVIDPILSYATLLGGTGLDEAVSVKVDTGGNVYLAGTTSSPSFPGAAGAPQGLDVFVSKLNSRGALLYSAYVGGTGVDEARDLAVDADGNVYVTGLTASADFPTRSPRQAALGGETDAFVFKLSTTGGGLLFSTYHGGSGADEATGVAVDGGRNVAISGHTRSANFPLEAANQGALLGQLDGFVARFAPTGSSLVYSTYVGGAGADAINAIYVDVAGTATVTGSSTSADFPLAGAAYPTNAGLADVVICRFTPAGALSYSTYVGGGGIDVGQAIVVNPTGAVFVAGTTESPNFPVVSPIQGQLSGNLDAFLLVINPGFGLAFSTYYGGSRSERGRSLAMNAAGRLVLVGQTMSSNFPVTRAAQGATGGNRDTFVVQFDPPYTAATYATYLGGSNNDEGTGAAIDAIGRVFVTGSATFPFPVAQGASDAFVYGLSTGFAGEDTDGDLLPDEWETQYGTDPMVNDAAADPDGDGVTNAAEYANGTHPLGFYTRYLAEGATGSFFDDRVALFNPSSSMAMVVLRYQRPAPLAELQQIVPMQPHSRMTVNPETFAGLEATSFSTVVESDQPVVVDRTMTWDASGFGSHAETSSEQPSTHWYLAEGATGGTFDLYYLLQNPNAGAATVAVTYLRPAPQAPLTKTYTVPPRSRLTINVDNECFVSTTPCPSTGRMLSNSDVSAKIESTNDVPILVERAMYMTSQGRVFNAGHDAAGVTSPAASWFLAEGATGTFFDMFILLANPTAFDTTVEVRYLLDGGAPIDRTYALSANSRRTIYVDAEPGLGSVATSAIVRSTNPAAPIVVERAMWWPDGNWIEAHDSAGAIVTSPRWALAEGEVGGPRSTLTYVLLANTSAAVGDVRVRVYYEDQGPFEERTFSVAGEGRTTVDMAGAFPNTEGRRFSVLIDGLGATPPELVVERAMYSNVGSTLFAAGTNALATPLFPDATFTSTPNGVFPKVLVVDEGTQVQILNHDPTGVTPDCTVGVHNISADPHPQHSDSPEFGDLDLPAGRSRLTQNLVIPGSFGVHDHCNPPPTGQWEARVIVRP